MACIDIFAPGRVLSVPFLMEQVWLDNDGADFKAVEVYDFLLQADDDLPLEHFYIASPHFCQVPGTDGQWHNTATLSRVRGHDSGWGWFYLQPPSLDDCYLTMAVASPYPEHDLRPRLYRGVDARVGSPTSSLSQKHEHYASITWSDDLKEDNLRHAMRAMRKSLFHVRLTPGLQGAAQEQMWFRLVVVPAILDVASPRRPWERSVSEKLLPFYAVTSHISCPTAVRRLVALKLNEMRLAQRYSRGEPEDIGRILMDNGFNARGTTTRILDHRIVLGAYRGFHVSLHGSSREDTIQYFGPQSLHPPLRIPRISDHCLPSNFSGTSMPEDDFVHINRPIHNWLTGSYRNLRTDLVTVCNALVGEIRYAGATTKEGLAMRILPHSYREGCVLIENMILVGLLVRGEGGMLSVISEGHPHKICELRRVYANPNHGSFADFPSARHAFSDLHSFHIDFTCSWIVESGWRWLVVILVFCGSLISIARSIADVLRWLVR